MEAARPFEHCQSWMFADAVVDMLPGERLAEHRRRANRMKGGACDRIENLTAKKGAAHMRKPHMNRRTNWRRTL